MKLRTYDKYIVAFSGGKDSIATFLSLLEMGIPVKDIELWHHDIDGNDQTFMEWECTPYYCYEFAKAFGVQIYFSWKDGGFYREMSRNNSPTARNYTQIPSGGIIELPGRDTKGTRLKFPQVSPDLSVRWCSAYLKIDVCASAVRGQDRFLNSHTAILSGERAQESAARAKYAMIEPDRADNRKGIRVNRYVDRIRPVKEFTEKQVWALIEKYKVRAHPCYYLGWSRCSCKFCIFGNANQFASAYALSPKQGDVIINLEKKFDCTIKRKLSLPELIEGGTKYKAITAKLAKVATSHSYTLPIFTDHWQLPAGAFGENCGPS